jgi:site-specific DNA-methyltransferase (adenine-specific)
VSAAWVVHEGDALDVLRGLDAGSVDVVLTDPPYSSGGAFRGDRQQSTEIKYSGFTQNADGWRKGSAGDYPEFTGDTRDQRSFLTWFGLWAGQCRRVAKPGAHFFTFTDWRQLPTMTDAVQVAGWVWRGLAVWDKGIGRPMKGRFRNHLEYIVWATNGPTSEPEDVYLPSLFRHSPPNKTARLHRTEKPAGLIAELLRLSPSGATVLDPFAGSGSTGEACLQTGRKFVGVELEPTYAGIARRRLTEVEASAGLFAPGAA